MTVIGIVVIIPEPWGSQLDEHRVASGDPHAHLIPAHLTLLGPVAVNPDEVAEVEAHLAGVAARHEPFQLHLRGTATFRPVTPVVYVAVAGGVDGCARLAADVNAGPLDRELDYPYVPHVTIAHERPDGVLDAAAHGLASFEARFPVDGFTLFELGADQRWHPRHRFPLAAVPARLAPAPLAPAPLAPAPLAPAPLGPGGVGSGELAPGGATP